MNDKLTRLAERRESLVSQSAFQRVTLAQNFEPWLLPLPLAGRGLAALRFIKSHPAWIVGGVVLLSVLHSDSLGKSLRGGWIAWLFIRKLREK
jgi:hypothetical protein